METHPDIAAIEARAYIARVTMRELCTQAGIFQQSWSRCKANNKASVIVLRKLEAALDAVEAERKAA